MKPVSVEIIEASQLSFPPSCMFASTAQPPWAASASGAVWRFGRAVQAEGGTGGVQWVLRRNCSLTPSQLGGFYLSICAVSLIIALGFAWNGAPVVLWFAGIELALLAVALLVYARHAGDSDTVTLCGQTLTVEQSFGAQTTSSRFRSPWVSVEPLHGDGSLVELSGHGQVVRVGRFLRPEARSDFARELRSALRLSLQPAAETAGTSPDHSA